MSKELNVCQVLNNMGPNTNSQLNFNSSSTCRYKIINVVCGVSNLTKGEDSIMDNILVCVLSLSISEKEHKVININSKSINTQTFLRETTYRPCLGAIQ